ncbi:beta strand repeat-containing protein [Singulisphaera sp. PoT]|uniref:beta strand repeat-containing protein n=1 Tax=Singulisphaera sp. PoT TaxID=3411797 RepID=UPI003BF5BE2B
MAFRPKALSLFHLAKSGARAGRRQASRPRLNAVETLEDRELLSTFAVTSLGDNGAGTLRRAILQANATPGPDTISFDVAGTIRISRTSLPAITDRVAIDGTTAPGFSGTPVVGVNFSGTLGLRFNQGSDGSSLTSLSLVRAKQAGVTLNASHIVVQGNYIGLMTNGVTVAGNRGDGIRINAGSHDNLIGRKDPVSSVQYFNASSVSMQPVSAWQGIRENPNASGQYLIVGTSGNNGLLYEGPISGVGGTSFSVNVPNANSTSVYGPNVVKDGLIQLVGSYKDGNDKVNGFLFQGTTSDLSNPGAYRTIDYPGAKYTYVHSTMGGLAVGNADGPEGNAPLGTGHAFLYDVNQDKILTDIVYPGSTTTTAYGIWQNDTPGGTSYTICGGYSAPGDKADGLAHGYLVDYDSATGKFSNWASFQYPNGAAGKDFISHFEGISGDQKGVYTLNADSLLLGSNGGVQGSFVTVRRNTDGSFGPSTWVDLNYPGIDGAFSSNSVAGNQVVGVVAGNGGVFSAQASINTGFQLSNVISGNQGNGIGIYGASDNQVAMNYIGTDPTGNARLGNGQNGILVTAGATRNLIGGEATGGNDPTKGVFVRPPQGNLISGNRGNGVLIIHGANHNVLAGNFVGTTASGNAALGNRQDGVAIDRADNNQLLGCTFQQDPFVFYNVISGNGGNGVRVTDSNDTTIQANFMGVGANNATLVPNGGDGLLVSGSSSGIQVGGVIPLGNVISGNRRNGIEVKDRATGFVSFNTFAGLYAFGGAAPNGQNGILITSSGGNNLIRTSIVSGNVGNGIVLSGNATGVQVTESGIGTNTVLTQELPNGGDGILISGKAHDNAIGGFQASIVPQVTISANGGYGIRVVGSARNNQVVNTFIGTSAKATKNLANHLGGIYLGRGTSGTTIGGTDPNDRNDILFNDGNGVTIASSTGNVLLGNNIGSNTGSGVFVQAGRGTVIGSATAGNSITGNGVDGVYLASDLTGSRVEGNGISGNVGNGVTLAGTRRVVIGGSSPGAGNRIDKNQGFGLAAFGICTDTVVQQNVIVDNTQGNVDLSKSTGVTYLS